MPSKDDDRKKMVSNGDWNFCDIEILETAESSPHLLGSDPIDQGTIVTSPSLFLLSIQPSFLVQWQSSLTALLLTSDKPPFKLNHVNLYSPLPPLYHSNALLKQHASTSFPLSHRTTTSFPSLPCYCQHKEDDRVGDQEGDQE